MDRRTVLSSAAGIGTVSLTGCLGILDDESDEDGSEDDGTETTPDGGTETTTDAAEDSRTSFTLGFEDPQLTAWTVEDDRWGRSEAYAYSGDASAGVETDDEVSLLATASPSELGGGAQIRELKYYWRETSNSNGGGLVLVNSDGEFELFTGSNNPQWNVINEPEIAQRNEPSDGYGYERWIETALTFDWDDGTVEVAFTDLTAGEGTTGTFDLVNGTDVETLRLYGLKTSEYREPYEFRAGSCHMHWDEITVTI
ncbi:hypothetical protein [Haloarcula salinisoli]|uniref:Uncharacterized protein n=1 Tax=Haloarcula salinisoli TaxID=2487746 RepID=A0A8J7YDQ2_9EURY|nr:hypothetical protein [Halomicroarcula salinisoli]MBX0303577.1 hypothetical protein [Halomicroarcula salinisoli]